MLRSGGGEEGGGSLGVQVEQRDVVEVGARSEGVEEWGGRGGAPVDEDVHAGPDAGHGLMG